jgi:hypothetical protein
MSLNEEFTINKQIDIFQIYSLIGKYIAERLNLSVSSEGIIRSIHDPAMNRGILILEALKYLNEDVQPINWEINRFNISGTEADSIMKEEAINNIYSYTGIDLTPSIFDARYLLFNEMSYDVIVIDTVRYFETVNDKHVIMFNNVTYIKYIMKSLNVNGSATIIVPPEVLFSDKRRYIKIRHKLLHRFNLHHIVSVTRKDDTNVYILFFDNNGRTQSIDYYYLDFEDSMSKEQSSFDLAEERCSSGAISETYDRTIAFEDIVSCSNYNFGEVINLEDIYHFSDSDSNESNTSEYKVEFNIEEQFTNMAL